MNRMGNSHSTDDNVGVEQLAHLGHDHHCCSSLYSHNDRHNQGEGHYKHYLLGYV